jgi:hypothetical protein
MTVGLSQAGVDNEAVAVLHQRMSHEAEAELGLLARRSHGTATRWGDRVAARPRALQKALEAAITSLDCLLALDVAEARWKAS